jgi:multidrug efflux pump subunit AcrB
MRYLVVAIIVALLVIAFWYAGRYMDFVLFPTQSADEFYMLVELPSGSSLEHTKEKLAEVEALVQALPAGELDSMASLFVAFVAAAVGIYLILLLLFDSMVQPLLVMFAIPFGLVGVIFAFAVHVQPLGFLAMLGVVGLTGIVVNDSLILVNLLNRLRRQHPENSLPSQIVEAASSRLRPILLTSFTTVAGLLPMAYGLGGSDPFSAPMALAMGYGILFATPLTLLLLPCLLVLQDDLSERIVRQWAALRW